MRCSEVSRLSRVLAHEDDAWLRRRAVLCGKAAACHAHTQGGPRLNETAQVVRLDGLLIGACCAFGRMTPLSAIRDMPQA
jgi:hypothetical protein